MKLTAELDITPEEVRKLLGMPEYNWLNETFSTARHSTVFDGMKWWQDQIKEAADELTAAHAKHSD